ncbi:MAG: 6-phosphofructokinase [Thauera propionica]|jgi:6-phosphofructokinase 1|uniref:Pyrophosphate--fructose 6-phosphate 1-phosphotransferase n=1 Tax=Thauera propionica TaxID=2019431 RepID=A0A235EYC1_9RHOO|nr:MULTISPECIES: 6-phosphofructokinase [Thauera]MDD3675713.1 6-phosphofructokinase [Thauera propionica]MDI3490528.1 ATP-dependent phosphofructokinase / diphosphate-dependent phosphofructokinase [Thauera sp.]MDY0047548.1 6-phosphofructokinase [Thauera propionica]OYD53577.1 6-phosphofructokinase [Thauera propionica]
MMRSNLLYAHSGGVTAVINASAAAVISAARARPERIGKVFAARRGILGVLAEDLYDTEAFDQDALARLTLRPGGAFGSCRFDVPSDDGHRVTDRLFEVFAAHDIGYFVYNGGNGSMDAVARLRDAARERAYPLICVGVPKTVDNDIVGTDCCPGFGSAAKYLATSMLEAGLDIASMVGSRGSVFVMEVMGRNTGWLAAATALAANGDPDAAPHIVLVPEATFDEEAFLAEVQRVTERLGYCAITVAEGIRRPDGSLIMEKSRDPRGYVQLGGAGSAIARMIHERLGYKHHWAIPDYLQRSAGHWLSAVDHAQAVAVGRAAVELALDGHDGVFPAIRRLGDAPYRWDVTTEDAGRIANLERKLPPAFLRADGLHVTHAACDYIRPLIGGEVAQATRDGLPDYGALPLLRVPRRLSPWAA